MTADDKSILKSILEHISGMDYIKPEDLPNIDLYMDQVTTFMEDQLASTKRHDDDKILTKTMINNYAKNNLLPSPEKKRYSKDHLLMLIFIYYFKNILSITDIQKLLGAFSGLIEPGNILRITDIGRCAGGVHDHSAAVSASSRMIVRVVILILGFGFFGRTDRPATDLRRKTLEQHR